MSGTVELREDLGNLDDERFRAGIESSTKSQRSEYIAIYCSRGVFLDEYLLNRGINTRMPDSHVRGANFIITPLIRER